MCVCVTVCPRSERKTVCAITAANTEVVSDSRAKNVRLEVKIACTVIKKVIVTRCP